MMARAHDSCTASSGGSGHKTARPTAASRQPAPHSRDGLQAARARVAGRARSGRSGQGPAVAACQPQGKRGQQRSELAGTSCTADRLYQPRSGLGTHRDARKGHSRKRKGQERPPHRFWRILRGLRSEGNTAPDLQPRGLTCSCRPSAAPPQHPWSGHIAEQAPQQAGLAGLSGAESGEMITCLRMAAVLELNECRRWRAAQPGARGR